MFPALTQRWLKERWFLIEFYAFGNHLSEDIYYLLQILAFASALVFAFYLMKLFRKPIFLSVCHPERSEGPHPGYNTLERDPSVVIRSFAALRITDFLTF